MSTLAHRIINKVETIKGLRHLQKKMDPASGITIAIKRGPLVQADEVEHELQGPSDPYLYVEADTYMTEIVDAAINAALESLKLNLRFAISESHDLSSAIMTAKTFLGET